MEEHIKAHLQFMDTVYGLSDYLLVDYEKYRGRGRPRKTDYITFEQAQKKINSCMYSYIESRDRAS